MTALTFNAAAQRRYRTLAMFALNAGAAQPVTGMVDEPCPPPLPLPPSAVRLLSDLFFEPRTLQPADFAKLGQNAEFAAFQKESRQRAAQDWAGLCRYRADNDIVRKAGGRPRVFMGDSITENWAMADPAFFSGKTVGRGISAQTTAQMLLRFRPDVVSLNPSVVHILAGTNDIAGNNGPVSPRDFQNNIESMVEIARANGIKVILGSIPPAIGFSWRPGMPTVPRIRELNDWLRSYASRNGSGLRRLPHGARRTAGGTARGIRERRRASQSQRLRGHAAPGRGGAQGCRSRAPKRCHPRTQRPNQPLAGTALDSRTISSADIVAEGVSSPLRRRNSRSTSMRAPRAMS